MPSWADLNERQQKYLQEIYNQDQENERHEKSQWTRGSRPRPAIEWRWMFYGIMPETGSDSPLRRRLKVANLVDPGTGATFQALESRRYVLCRYEPVVGSGDPFVYIQITPAGRKLVRAATGEQRGKALSPGTLREWHWKAMVGAWKSRPAGVEGENGYYGHSAWNTWLRLRDFKAGPLIEEYTTSGEYLAHVGYTRQIHWLKLSALGEEFYRENWQQYRELYPEVDAPEPD